MGLTYGIRRQDGYLLFFLNRFVPFPPISLHLDPLSPVSIYSTPRPVDSILPRIILPRLSSPLLPFIDTIPVFRLATLPPYYCLYYAHHDRFTVVVVVSDLFAHHLSLAPTISTNPLMLIRRRVFLFFLSLGPPYCFPSSRRDHLSPSLFLKLIDLSYPIHFNRFTFFSPAPHPLVTFTVSSSWSRVTPRPMHPCPLSSSFVLEVKWGPG